MSLNQVTNEVLNDQIKILNAQFTKDDIDTDIVDLENEDDELTEQQLTKLLAKVNQKKRAYYGRIFTQQAIRHVIMQVEESFKSQVSEARQELMQERNQAFVSTDPTITQHVDQHVGNIQEDELVKLAKNLTTSHTTPEISKLTDSLQSYYAARSRNENQQQLKSKLESTFTDSPQEHVQQNLVTSQSPILDELAKLRMLCAKLQAKSAANPEKFKELTS